jgi:glutamate 5-kinase
MKIVIKVGTQAILSAQGMMRTKVITSLVDQIATLQRQGHHVALVSSGAVGAGRRVAREVLHREYGSSIAEKQVLASLGQHELMHFYATLFKKHHLLSAQLLLTKQDFHTRQHYLNIARLLREIISDRTIIPIINENDSVAIEELMFTDNDELAGLISAQLNADKLIILSSVKGVYDGHPDEPNSKVIPVLNPQDKWHQASSLKSTQGRGGMVSKLATARKMSGLGIMTHIADLDEPDVILRLVQGEQIGTAILPFKKQSNMKRWIAFSTKKHSGSITINACLFNILEEATKVTSILPVGIEKYTGEFTKGDLVEILSPTGQKIGAGIARYSSAQLHEVLGSPSKPVFIHYDHLYLELNPK